MAKKAAKKLKITLVRSTIHRLQVQKDTVRALGLLRMHHTVEHTDTPSIRGMINRVTHLVKVEDV